MTPLVNDEQGRHPAEQEYLLNLSTGLYEKIPTCYVVRDVSKRGEHTNCQTMIEE